MDHVPEPVIKLDSKIEKLKEYIRKIYRTTPDFTHKLTEKAAKGWLKTFEIPGASGYDLESYLKDTKGNMVKMLEDNVEEMKGIKTKFIVKCEMQKTNIATGETILQEAYFHSDNGLITKSTHLSDTYNSMCQKVFESMAQYQRQGNNWTLNQVRGLDIHINIYAPLAGSSYISLPAKLAKKKAIINMKNSDDKCFTWSVLRALHPKEEHPERIDEELTNKEGGLNMRGIEYPVTLKAIDKFEGQNASISVNVFGYEREVYPLRISKTNHETVVDLLLISEGDIQHYCWIKNKSRLLSSQSSKKGHERFYCNRCLNSFNTKESLQSHMEYCSSKEAVKIVLPTANEDGSMPTLSFGNYKNSMRVPFVVYADFECFTQKISTCSPDSSSSYTKQYQKHTPSGVCYYIKSTVIEVYDQEPVIFTKQSEDDDVAQIFVEKLEENIKEIYHKIKFPKEMIFTKKDRDFFDDAIICHICDGELETDRVRDHCHLTGKFRGAAHNKCNLQYKIPKFFPVIFHNLSGYDSHLFIKNLGVSEGNISYIPNNEEKYISFTKKIVVDTFTNKEGEKVEVKRDIRFIDSFKFMASSLGALTSNLEASKFKTMREYYSGSGVKQLDLLLRKGVYPYDYVDSMEKLDDTVLPPIEEFYSKLNDTNISEEDYQHAQTVWSEFNIKNMREYHDLYLKSDVLLLADVFENFRDVCLENYKLDPAWYYTSTGLAWDAALKLTGVKLELSTDVDMLLMVEKGIRGGISTISTRYGKANNPYMGKEYDPNLPTKYITYLDANNLYGWAMSKSLPTHGFQWMTDVEMDNWRQHPCILEVDLEYPESLHDLHNDYPLAPERVKVEKVDGGHSVPKHIPNLNNKTKYIIHYENLKLYESLGMKITKIHRGI